MPWHKRRVFYDREGERRRRGIYRLDISILVASALLLIVIIAGLLPFADFWFAAPTPVAAGNTFDYPTATQKLCIAVGLLCVVYISVALNMRAKP